MTDIAKCAGRDCPQRDTCLRYTMPMDARPPCNLCGGPTDIFSVCENADCTGHAGICIVRGMSSFDADRQRNGGKCDGYWPLLLQRDA